MAISNERIRLAEFMAQEDPAAVAQFIAGTTKMQSALLDFYGPNLDVTALVTGLQGSNHRKVEKIRDFLDRFLEVRAGKLPLGRMPFQVRTQAARDEMRENAALAKKSFSEAAGSVRRGNLLSAAFHGTKFLTEASAMAMSSLMLTQRERKLGMLLGLEMTAVAAFGGTSQAAIDHGAINDAIDGARKTNIEERMGAKTRGALEITVSPNGGLSLNRDFGSASKTKAEKPFSAIPRQETQRGPSAAANI